MLATQEISTQQLRQFADGGYLYAIVDACDAPLVPPKMKALGQEKAISLFQGSAQEDYWAVAPYLAHVDNNLLRWLFENLWKEPWGIFVMSKIGLQDLCAHFRKFLVLEVEGERNAFFRYYDPRVLPGYLRTCDAAELKMFYGPVRAYGLVHENGGTVFSIAPLINDR